MIPTRANSLRVTYQNARYKTQIKSSEREETRLIIDICYMIFYYYRQEGLTLLVLLSQLRSYSTHMSTVVNNKKQKSKMEFGVSIPRETAERIEAVKGPYLSRAKFIWIAIDRLIQEEEKKQRLTAVGAVPNT